MKLIMRPQKESGISPDFTWAIGFKEMFLPLLGEGRDHCFREQYSRLPGFMVRIFFCSGVIGSKECLRPFLCAAKSDGD